MTVDQEEIHRLSLSENIDDRLKATWLLKNDFHSISNKFTAWDDLHRLTEDNEFHVRSKSAKVLGIIFNDIPEEHKSVACDDLHRLSTDTSPHVRCYTTDAIGLSFNDIPEEQKSTAWEDLIRLTEDKNLDVKYDATLAFVYVFRSIPEGHKSAAWGNLMKLINDVDYNIRVEAARILGFAFSIVPEEQKSIAWNDLHKLTSDDADIIKSEAARVLGTIYKDIYEEHKSITWNDLVKLSNDKNPNVKMYANHSLGKVCIYKASKSGDEDVSRALLEKAIQYFKKSMDEKQSNNPSTFCYLFYCSFDAVLFRKVSSKEDINNYIEAAKKEIGSSESKKKLLEAIEKLAVILEKTNNTTQSEVNLQEIIIQCSDICNEVEILMKENRDKAPSIYDLYEKAFPSFKSTIKKRIERIKKNVNILYIRAIPEFKDVALNIKQESDSILPGDYQHIDTLNSKLDALLNNLRGGILSNPILSEKSKNEISLKIVNALNSDNAIQKADVVDESIIILLQKTSDHLREKIIKSIGVGGVLMSAIVLITPKNPTVAIIFGLLITLFTYYLI